MPVSRGHPARPPSLLIALPQGLNVSGVTMWALRLANALVRSGGAAGLILHPEPAGQSRLDLPIDDRVRITDLSDRTPIPRCAGDLAPYTQAYARAVGELASQGPVAVCPNLHGDCFGIVATLAQTMPSAVRVVAWQHSDIAYDTRLIAHYEPMLSSIVAVSDRIESRLGRALPARSITNIPYGVEVPQTPPARPPLGGRPLELLYTGRLEHQQKRVDALVALADELAARHIDAHLTLLGDGPAAGQIDRACAARANLTRLPPTDPPGVRARLARADAFVLASRYEGLSISMLEALAQGCVPIVTRVDSGAAQAIDHGRTGLLASAGPDDDEQAVACALADQIQTLDPAILAELAINAWRTARDRFSLDAHADTVTAMLRDAAASPPRPWPATRPCAYSGSPSTATGGSVPARGPDRLRTVLESLAGQTIILHGAGQHTIELAGVLAHSPATIAAVADDDPASAGQTLLGWPIIMPSDAAATGASAVVISSWMHQQAIWARRRVYEDQGLRVVRIYPEPITRQPPEPALCSTATA